MKQITFFVLALTRERTRSPVTPFSLQYAEVLNKTNLTPDDLLFLIALNVYFNHIRPAQTNFPAYRAERPGTNQAIQPSKGGKTFIQTEDISAKDITLAIKCGYALRHDHSKTHSEMTS